MTDEMGTSCPQETFNYLLFQTTRLFVKDLKDQYQDYLDELLLETCSTSESDSTPQPHQGYIFAVGGDVNEGTITVEKFCRRTNTWTAPRDITSLMGGLTGFACAVFDSELIITGGMLKNNEVNKVKKVLLFFCFCKVS